MEFKFKIQKYQTDAVDSVIEVFEGQDYQDSLAHRHDFGNDVSVQTNLLNINEVDNFDYSNSPVSIPDSKLLTNIQNVQRRRGLPLSKTLVKNIGVCSLDIEMETGTGKTYVYTRTMFELNKRYGWSKFIIVVPSIAIREGVKKSLQTTEKHFKKIYNKIIKTYVYDSSRLYDIDDYSQRSDICALIINSQAFTSSFKEGARGDASRKIYSIRDEFGSRRPIDVLAANNPILILDEPQKLDGKITQESLKNQFNALFSLNYSATHKTKHNKIFVLDALDAYNNKLVKKIEVKGIEMRGIGGVEKYLYLEDIIIDSKNPPKALIEIEIKTSGGSIRRKTMRFDKGDDIFLQSGLESYRNLIVSEIDPISGFVKFTDGTEIIKGEVVGDYSEKNLRRIQIREAIISHFEKEQQLFPQGIKCLTLFFIDEVAKYRNNNEDDNLGEYALVFEEEYNKYLKEHIFTNPAYKNYLDSISVRETHKGYFSIDKKTKHFKDSDEKKSGNPDDVDAYDLIMSRKELLLDIKEHTRFIFSHSALREGWDNPNIFQICVLKKSSEKEYRRQEVGRGLRLCVDQDGNRMDYQTCGDSIHEINTLTVIAGEGYDTFVRGLQDETKSCVSEGLLKIDENYFKGRTIMTESGIITIDEDTADLIQYYLIEKKFINYKGQIEDSCRDLIISGQTILPDLPDRLIPIAEGLTDLVIHAAENRDVSSLFVNGRRPKIVNNKLNDNFYKKEFQELWNRINKKYAYTASFDSEELIRKSISSINKNLFVTEASYNIRSGQQISNISKNDLNSGSSFDEISTRHGSLNNVGCFVKHDLIGELSRGCKLTRRTIVSILKGISTKKYGLYSVNPEEFIANIISLINEQKATTIVDEIKYDVLEGSYDSSIFTMSRPESDFEKAFFAKKHIQDYVFTDGIAEKSVERRFAEELDKSEEVSVYAKLPRALNIPTPVGNYSPDWAIAFREGSVKHIFFIAETKGSMQSLQLRAIEHAKIRCASKLFNQMSSFNVKYHAIADYSDLMRIVNED